MFFTGAASHTSVAVLCGRPEEKKPPFPDLDGQETVAEFLAKYKKHCLGKKTAYKELQDKIAEEKPSTGTNLVSISSVRLSFPTVF